MTQLSEVVRNERSSKGWSQLELATRAGIDRKTVNRMENGKYTPSIETLCSVSTALGVSVDYLLGN